MGRLSAAFTFTLLVLCATGLAADQRVDPMDIIVALDKSLSMEEEITAVKEYVSTALVDHLLIPNDLFIIVAFYGKTDILVSTLVGDEAAKTDIRKAISPVSADGRWTDIGGALDALKAQIEAHGRPGVPKHLLLITDGKPEPPPGSKYWSPDGSFTHEFLENTRVIQMAGWKVHVLGIGSAADARELAEELSGAYTELPDNPTAEQLEETTRDFLGSIAVDGAPRISAIGRGGAGTITLTAKSSGFESAKTLVLTRIKLTSGQEVREDLLPGTEVIEIPASGITKISLPILVEPLLAPGRYSGTFDFFYATDERITPAVLTLDFRVNSMLLNNLLFIIPGAILVVAGLVLLVLLLARQSAAGRVTFRIVVAEFPLKKGHDVFTLAPGADRYLEENDDVIGLTEAKTPRSIARLYVAGDDPARPILSMEVLAPKSFAHPKEVPASLVGAEVQIKDSRERKLHLTFEAADPHA